MTLITLPTMLLGDVELRIYPGDVGVDPMTCGHVWEPHAVESGWARCKRCCAQARWVNDPRLEEPT